MRHIPQQLFHKQSAGVLFRAGLACLLLAFAGCIAPHPSVTRSEQSDRIGRTYYIDGAGNWGYGVPEVKEGLRKAGYAGTIINYQWSPTLNPALDQTVGRVAAKARGKHLGKEISAYLHDYPNNQVNIIALSAGTGVAVWACENLAPPAKLNSLVLLGSSLSSRYDMGKALANISGGVWVYYSPNDQMLSGPVRALGTIDGRMIANSAGLVGLHPPHGDEGKIHNIGWTTKWQQYGWAGSHTGATTEPFVEHVLAQHIIPSPPADQQARQDASAEQASFTPNQPATQPTTQPADQNLALRR